MGEIHNLHYITMLVSESQEEAIRDLFEEKTWKCWIRALTEEMLDKVKENRLTEIFPHFEDDRKERMKDDAEIKDGIEETDLCSDEIDDKNLTDSEDVTSDSLRRSPKTKKLRTDKSSAEKKTESQKVKKENHKVKCTFCDMYVSNQYILQRHCRRRHKDVWLEFECKDCPSRFKTREDLWQHRNEVNHKQPDDIPKREQKRHHTPEELVKMGHVKCNFCEKFYPTKRLLRRHLYAVHRDLLPKWNCSVCNLEYETREELWKHKRDTKHNTSIWTLGHYQCDGCGKIYNRYDSFLIHKQLACCKEENEIEEMRIHPCDVCGMKFKSVNHMKAHKNSVHLNAPEVCDVCGAQCKNKRALSSHQKRHDMKKRKYACDECGKSFFSSAILKQHIRTHTKEKPYKCPMCTYTCAVKQNIHKHSLKIHKVQAKAIDLRHSKDKSTFTESCDVYHQNDVHLGLDPNSCVNNSYHKPGQNGHYQEVVMQVTVPDEHKIMMKIPPASDTMKITQPMETMVLPESNTTSYLEMMNYNMHNIDYAQPNVHHIPHSQYQY